MDECHLGGGCLRREAACHSDKAIISQTAKDSNRCFWTERSTFCSNYYANRTLIKEVNVMIISLFVIAGKRPCTIISLSLRNVAQLTRSPVISITIVFTWGRNESERRLGWSRVQCSRVVPWNQRAVCRRMTSRSACREKSRNAA